jgi:hypothetical protein
MLDNLVLRYCIDKIGADRATDYPYEPAAQVVSFLESAPIIYRAQSSASLYQLPSGCFICVREIDSSRSYTIGGPANAGPWRSQSSSSRGGRECRLHPNRAWALANHRTLRNHAFLRH